MPRVRPRRRLTRRPKIPRGPARRVGSPQPPRAVEHYLVAAFRRAAARAGRALWSALEPRLSAIAKPSDEDTRLDAPADGGAGSAIKAARAAVAEVIGGVKADVESSTRVAAKRTDRHSQSEFERLGIKLADTEPGIAKLVPAWRKENVARITGMVDDQLAKIERILEDGDGMRAETLAKEIRRQCVDVTDSRAELIARDQVLTLNAQITKERQTAVGIEQYVWTTSNDERVREEHQELEGKTFSWDDSPDEGHPGEAVMCRCVAFPILPELDD